MQGSADHFHAITFYPEHFETLQAGDEAIVNTDGTVESSHVHVVFVQCL